MELPKQVGRLTILSEIDGEVACVCRCGKPVKRSKVSLLGSIQRGHDSACSKCRKKKHHKNSARMWGLSNKCWVKEEDV